LLPQSITQHILLLDALVAQYDVFSTTFHTVGTHLLKEDEKAADTLAFTIVDSVPECKQTGLQELTNKFTATIEKFGGSD
jgi:hypothetical protein